LPQGLRTGKAAAGIRQALCWTWVVWGRVLLKRVTCGPRSLCGKPTEETDQMMNDLGAMIIDLKADKKQAYEEWNA